MIIILLKQITAMFLMMSIGYFLYKGKKITLQGNKELGTILIYVILPASIIKSYIVEITHERVVGLLVSFVAAVLALALSVIISRVVFGNKLKIEHFGTAFSNAGFIGIPLVKSVVGEEAVFYIATFVALLNILQWTYGVIVMSGKKDSISLKKIITNPVIIALVIGLGLFVSQIPVHSIIINTLGSVGNMTAPVAMITLGVYLGQMSLKELLNEKWTYVSTILRLIIIPLSTAAIFSFIPSEYNDIKLAVLIAASAPVGSNVAVFAQIHELDYTRAVKSVCLSTVFSIASMPVIIGISEMVWKWLA